MFSEEMEQSCLGRASAGHNHQSYIKGIRQSQEDMENYGKDY